MIKTRLYKSGKVEMSVHMDRKKVGKIYLLDFDQPGCYISHFSVIDAYRNNGIGSDLFNKCLKRAISRGCTAASLHVAINNYDAIRFYLRNGFFIACTTTDKENKHYFMCRSLIGY